MKTKTFALLLLLPFIYQAQEKLDYQAWKKQADSLFEKSEYKAAAEAYVNAFATIDGKAYPDDRYQLAVAYSQAQDSEQAFYHLNYLADKSMQNLAIEDIKTDSLLNNLHADERWTAFIKRLDDYQTELQKNYNWELVYQLDSIYELDQGIRNEYFEMGDKFDWESEEMKAFTKRWREIDEQNELKVTKILNEYGWLGKEVVSPKGNTTLFLVIQHAPLETQQKYLPMMREAVKEGNASASSLALLEDRVALREGKKQIYGSQIGSHKDSEKQYVLPLEDPINVDERRKSVGLGPLSEYVARFGFEWNVEQYLKMLPTYEEWQKDE